MSGQQLALSFTSGNDVTVEPGVNTGFSTTSAASVIRGNVGGNLDLASDSIAAGAGLVRLDVNGNIFAIPSTAQTKSLVAS